MAGAVALLGMVALAQAQDKALDPTGTWTWGAPGRNGNPGRTNTLTLKYSGGNLTGSLSTPRRNGNANTTDISNGKLTGDQISFTTTSERNGTTYTSTYTGTLTADTIKGKIAVTGGDNPRPPRNWTAKRSTSGS